MINPLAEYPGQVGPVDDDTYPYGEAQNITVPGDNTGTPWRDAIGKDMFGFFANVLAVTGGVPNGSPESRAVSDVMSGLDLMYGAVFSGDASKGSIVMPIDPSLNGDLTTERIIINWGTRAGGGGSITTTETFETPFTDALLFFINANGDATVGGGDVRALRVSVTQIQVSSSDLSVDVNWIAIGQ